ncbi:YbjN domain-containing protein [Alcaligenes sp. Marseille-Q7550]
MENKTLIETVTTDALTVLLQDMGYRVTEAQQGDIVHLLSAAQGIGFTVRPGNSGAEPLSYLDYTFSCVIRVEGTLAASLINRWNVEKRFARMALQGEFLTLEMDVVVAGGVSHAYLQAQTELWDRLLQEMILFLRGNPETPPAPGTASQPVDAALAEQTQASGQAA